MIAATNRDLEREVEGGRFRADLYHRLAVYPLRVPPLRERTEDIPLLAAHCLDQARRRLGLGPLRLSPEAREALTSAEWPGNVRELENRVAQAIAMAGGATVLKKEHLLPVDKSRRAALEPPTDLKSLREVLVETEREHLKHVLRAVGGHRSKAASVLGISRKVLWEKLRDYGIE